VRLRTRERAAGGSLADPANSTRRDSPARGPVAVTTGLEPEFRSIHSIPVVAGRRWEVLPLPARWIAVGLEGHADADGVSIGRALYAEPVQDLARRTAIFGHQPLRAGGGANRHDAAGGFPHGALAARIVTALIAHAQAAGGGLVQESSAGFDLPTGDTLEPDVTLISTGRLAAGPKPEHGQFLAIVPDLVVEILSPSTARRDRVEKKRIYARCGVEEYWLVDPRRREVAIFARAGDGTFGVAQVSRRGRLVSRVAFHIELKVEDLFADLG